MSIVMLKWFFQMAKNYELMTLLELVFLVIEGRCELCCVMVTHADWFAMCLSTYLLLSKNRYIEKFLKYAQWTIIRCVYSVIFWVQVTHSSQLQIVNKQFTPE